MSVDHTKAMLNDSKHQLDLDTITGGHVFYRFQDEEVYVSKLISFIRTGIERKQHILIIENLRMILKIKPQIDSIFSDEQLSSILLVNNFDYYLSNGDFNTKTILKHFQKDISTLKKHNSSIRTWAQVEWASTEPDAELLKEFESTADDFVIEERMISVCAYCSNRLSSKLNSTLEQGHKYVMTDDKIFLSSLYIK